MNTYLVVPLLAAISPFLLWPVEIFLPYPYVFEELVKAFLILPILKMEKKSDQAVLVLATGAIFALSEAVLYLSNIFLVGDISTFGARLAVTLPFHALTAFVIWLPASLNKKFVVFGFIAAMGMHYAFNLFAR
jgi:hypothetical protein